MTKLYARPLTFTHHDDGCNAMRKQHIVSLGRNKERGVRITMPPDRTAQLMPAITRILESYEAGRKQNAVSPLLPKPDELADASGSE